MNPHDWSDLWDRVMVVCGILSLGLLMYLTFELVRGIVT